MTRTRISIAIVTLLLLASQSGWVTAAPEAPGATITVNATGDDYGTNLGTCALREAIESANTDTAFGGCTAGTLGTDTIVLGSAIYYMYGSPGDEANASGDFDVLSPIVIQGLGIQQTIVDGNSIDRLFHVHETGSLSLSNLTIRNGYSLENGGAIYNRSRVSMTQVSLLFNQAALNGGAYAFQASSPAAPPTQTDFSKAPLTPPQTLICNNCYIQYNQANGYGGGIFSDGGDMELNNLYMELNIADENNDGNGNGGAIFTNDRVYLHYGEFIDNHSKLGSGGAIATGMGADMTVDNSYFRNNDSGSMGGAIYNGFDAILEMSKVEITGNSSLNSNGGGIANFGDLNILNATIADNSSQLMGAGIYTDADTAVVYLSFTTIAFNLDEDVLSGDGIAVDSGNVDLEATIVAWNGDGDDDGNNCHGTSGSFESQGYNLESGETCELDFVNDDLLNTDPRLGVLRMHASGNYTQTYNLLFDSPAIDSYSGDSCPSVDQRGFNRPIDGGSGVSICDRGAFEALPPVLFLPLVIRP